MFAVPKAVPSREPLSEQRIKTLSQLNQSQSSETQKLSESNARASQYFPYQCSHTEYTAPAGNKTNSVNVSTASYRTFDLTADAHVDDRIAIDKRCMGRSSIEDANAYRGFPRIFTSRTGSLHSNNVKAVSNASLIETAGKQSAVKVKENQSNRSFFYN